MQPQSQRARKKIPLKCLVLGAAGAGKTSILRRYFNKRNFEPGIRVPTVGSDFYVKTTAQTKLTVWDTPGRERYVSKQQPKYAASMTGSFFTNVDAIMLVYDMTSSTSFTQLLKWYADLDQVLYKSNPPPILIVANKLDIDISTMRMAPHRPKLVAQRDVLGLRGKFRGKDFRYEYRVSPAIKNSSSSLLVGTGRRMEISSFLATQENWTTDGSYLSGLLTSEDGSHPDREMVQLWCMRNGLRHMETSAATGQGVDEAMEALVQIALDAREVDLSQHSVTDGKPDTSPFQRNVKLDLQARYAPKENPCFFLKPIASWFK